MPRVIKCSKCDLVKDRVTFIRSLQENSSDADDTKELQLWVKKGWCICDECLAKADSDTLRLTCYRCSRQLPRCKCPHNQQRFAQQEDETPGHLGREPAYSCVECKEGFDRPSLENQSSPSLKRKHEDIQHKDEAKNQYYHDTKRAKTHDDSSFLKEDILVTQAYVQTSRSNKLTCVKCDVEKHRNFFIRTLREHARIFGD